jgi:hypothetical protein
VKPYFALFCAVVTCPPFCFSQSPAEKDLYEKLAKRDVEALETVLKTPDKYSPAILFLGAGTAFDWNKLEDSAFLFYAGQLRVRFDEKCFPPKVTGAEPPLQAYDAVALGLGSTINPTVTAKPKTFAKVIKRLEKWNPKAPKEYTPGYEFKDRLSEKDAQEAAKPNRTEFFSVMGGLSKLLNDAEYSAAYDVSRTPNLVTKEEFEKAMETMKRIEKDKGIKGFFRCTSAQGRLRDAIKLKLEGKDREARQVLQELVEKFGDMPEATEARKILAM